MLIFLGLIISLPLLGYVFFPLFDPAFKSKRKVKNSLKALHLEKDRCYEAIADWDFEYECGKLSEEDYRNLREKLISELSAVLKQLDEAEGGNT